MMKILLTDPFFPFCILREMCVRFFPGPGMINRGLGSVKPGSSPG